MEFVTKKVFKRDTPLIRELQAEYTLIEERRLTEAEVIEKALEELRHGLKKAKKKKYRMEDFIGSIKGGPKTNVAEDLDDVLYGEMIAD